jgi:hypothetical protein
LCIGKDTKKEHCRHPLSGEIKTYIATSYSHNSFQPLRSCNIPPQVIVQLCRVHIRLKTMIVIYLQVHTTRDPLSLFILPVLCTMCNYSNLQACHILTLCITDNTHTADSNNECKHIRCFYIIEYTFKHLSCNMSHRNSFLLKVRIDLASC